MVESACKIRKASLIGIFWWLDYRGVRLLWTIQSDVTSLTVIQSPTPYYGMEYSSTHNIMT